MHRRPALGKTSARRAGEISRRPPYPATTESWFIDYPRRGVSVRESPALLISRKLTRSPIARLSIYNNNKNKPIELVKHREGGISQPKILCLSKGHCDAYISLLCNISFIQPLVIFVLQYHRRFLGLCCAGTVPSPSDHCCTRTDRLAIARNITFSRPEVVVALVLKLNSSLMDSMAVTWLSQGSTSLCASLAIDIL